MIAAWMAYGIVLAALISAIAVAVDRGCRLLDLPRRWTWLTAMSASALAPAAALVAARWAPAAPAEPAEPVQPVVIFATDLAFVTQSWMHRLTALSSLDLPLLAFWGITTIALLTGLLLALWRMHREARGWPAAVVEGVPVLVAPDVGPAVIGTFPSSIVIPNWLSSLDHDQRRTVVRHEHEHLVRGDTRLLQVGLLLNAAVPWMLPLWWQFKRLRESIELDCDRRVLRDGIPTHDYARLLLHISTKQRPCFAPATTLADRPSLLARRIDSMLDQRRNHKGARLAGLALIAALITVAACDTPLPQSEVPVEARPQDGELDSAPVRLGGPAPRYPEMLRQAGIEGEVRIRVRIKIDGSVDSASVEVLQSTNRAFDAPAMHTVRGSRYEPAILDGEPVSAVVEQTVSFRTQRSADEDGVAPVGVAALLRTKLLNGAAERRAETTLVLLRNSLDGTRAIVNVAPADGDPLIFVDGLPATAAIIDQLAPGRIARIEVLKGAAATALLGNEARNGVIQVYLKPNN